MFSISARSNCTAVQLLDMVQVCLLGIAQDGGRPQVGCFKPCCESLTEQDRKYPVALGIIGDDGSRHLVEASRTMGEQLALWRGKCFECNTGAVFDQPIASVFVTHAHFGHIDGLGLFGRETMNARNVNLFVSESLGNHIRDTPTSRLMLEHGVFNLQTFQSRDIISPNRKTSAIADEEDAQDCGFVVEPVLVPHRAELSDMHAFIIRARQEKQTSGTRKRKKETKEGKSLLFLPDHDTWVETLSAHTASSILDFLRKMKVDIALLDGTFYDANELGHVSGRVDQQTTVPHPPVADQLEALGERKEGDPEVYFTHLNHTNPLYKIRSYQRMAVADLGWGVGEQGQLFDL